MEQFRDKVLPLFATRGMQQLQLTCVPHQDIGTLQPAVAGVCALPPRACFKVAFSHRRQKRSRMRSANGRWFQLCASMRCACADVLLEVLSAARSPVWLPITTASTSSLNSTLR